MDWIRPVSEILRVRSLYLLVIVPNLLSFNLFHLLILQGFLDLLFCWISTFKRFIRCHLFTFICVIIVFIHICFFGSSCWRFLHRLVLHLDILSRLFCLRWLGFLLWLFVILLLISFCCFSRNSFFCRWLIFSIRLLFLLVLLFLLSWFCSPIGTILSTIYFLLLLFLRIFLRSLKFTKLWVGPLLSKLALLKLLLLCSDDRFHKFHVLFECAWHVVQRVENLVSQFFSVGLIGLCPILFRDQSDHFVADRLGIFRCDQSLIPL